MVCAFHLDAILHCGLSTCVMITTFHLHFLPKRKSCLATFAHPSKIIEMFLFFFPFPFWNFDSPVADFISAISNASWFFSYIHIWWETDGPTRKGRTWTSFDAVECQWISNRYRPSTVDGAYIIKAPSGHGHFHTKKQKTKENLALVTVTRWNAGPTCRLDADHLLSGEKGRRHRNGAARPSTGQAGLVCWMVNKQFDGHFGIFSIDENAQKRGDLFYPTCCQHTKKKRWYHH